MASDRITALRAFVLLAIPLNAMVLLGVALHPKFVISLTSDSNQYLAIAYNIGNDFKVSNPLPHRTWPIGWPLLLSPAMRFMDPALRYACAYGIQLVWLNVLLWASFKALARLFRLRRALLLAAVVSGSLGITGFWWSLYSETVFTVFLCLALLTAVHAATGGGLRSWGGLGFLCAFATSIRPIGVGALLGAGLVLAALAWLERRIDLRRSAALAVGVLLGAFPEALQRLSVWLHPDARFDPQYPRLAGRYVDFLLRSVGDVDAVLDFLLPALWHELAFLFQFTLGGVVLLALCVGPVLRMLRGREPADRAVVAVFVFVAAFVLMQVAQATVHTLGYMYGDTGRDRIARYMMPASSLVLLGLFLLLPRADLRRRLLALRGWAFVVALVFSALLMLVFPFGETSDRLPNYGLLADWIDPIGFTLGTTPLFLVLFPLLWLGRRLRAGWLALAVGVLFVLPQATALPGRRERGRDFMARFDRAIAECELRLDGVERMYLLYSKGKVETPLWLLYTMLFLKHDLRYLGMTYAEFNALEASEKRDAVALTQGNGKLLGCPPLPGCRTRSWVRFFDCREPTEEPRFVSRVGSRGG